MFDTNLQIEVVFYFKLILGQSLHHRKGLPISDSPDDDKFRFLTITKSQDGKYFYNILIKFEIIKMILGEF